MRGVAAWVMGLTALLLSGSASAAMGELSTLPNGLRVALVDDHASPRVAVEMYYRVGSAMEGEGEYGFATLVTSMMGDRTRHVPAGRFKASLDEAGGQWSWDSDLERSSFSITVPSNFVELPLWLLSDQMGFFGDPWDEASVELVRARERERLRVPLEDPFSLAYRLSREESYPGDHPYHHAFDELPAHVSLDALKRFEARWFSPSNAVLVIAGDIQRDAVLALVTKYFGTLTGPPAPALPELRGVALEGEVDLTVATRTPTAVLLIGWPSPAIYEAGDADLDVAAKVLSGARVALLDWELTGKRKVASACGAVQRSKRIGSTFHLRVTAAPGHTADELLDGVDAVLSGLASGPVPDYYVARGVASYTIPLVLSFTDLAERAKSVASSVARKDKVDYFMSDDLARYDAVTPDSLLRTVRSFMRRDRRVVTFVVPSPNAPIGGVLVSRKVKPVREP